jgi:predicted small lipoprotein YifL
MKTLFTILLAILFALALTACGSKPIHPDKPKTPQEAAQQALDEANVDITAAASTLIQAYKDGAVSDANLRDWRETLNEARDAADKAQALLNVGDLSTAQGKIKAAQALLGVAQKRLLAIKKKTSAVDPEPVYI